MLDYNILMLVHPSSGDNKFYKVRDANHIVLIDSFGNEPQKEDKNNSSSQKIGKFIFQSTNFYGFSHNHPSSNNNLFLLGNIFGSGYPTLKAALNCISVSNPYLLLRNFSQIKQEL